MKKSKRILSLILVFLILMPLFSTIIFAEPDGEKNEEKVQSEGYELSEDIINFYKEPSKADTAMAKNFLALTKMNDKDEKTGMPVADMTQFDYPLNNTGKTNADRFYILNKTETEDNEKLILPELGHIEQDELENIDSYDYLREFKILHKNSLNDTIKALEDNNELKNSQSLLNPLLNRQILAEIQTMKAYIALHCPKHFEFPLLRPANYGDEKYLFKGLVPYGYYKFNGSSWKDIDERVNTKRWTSKIDSPNQAIMYLQYQFASNITNELSKRYKDNIASYRVNESVIPNEIFMYYVSNSDLNILTGAETGLKLKGIKVNDKVEEKTLGTAFPGELTLIPFDQIFTSEEVWKSDYGIELRKMLIERLNMIYIFGDTVIKLYNSNGNEDVGTMNKWAPYMKNITDSFNKYMKLRESYDKITLDEIKDHPYGLKYKFFDNFGGTVRDNTDTSSLSPDQKAEVSEALDKFPGIWNEQEGFTAAYKGLFSWTAAFTPFKTNIFDGTNKANLTEDEKDLITDYGMNRSILYTVAGNSGVLQNIYDKQPMNFHAISLAEFIKKAPTDELALFVRHENTKLVIDTDNKIDDVRGVGKEPILDSQAKEADEKVEVKSGSEEELDKSTDKTPTTDIKNSVGSFKVGETENLEFLGPFYISSGQHGKDIISLNDSSQNIILNRATWSKDNMKSIILGFLDQNKNGIENYTDTVKQISGEVDQLRSEEDAKNWWKSNFIGGSIVKTLSKPEDTTTDATRLYKRIFAEADDEELETFNERAENIAKKKRDNAITTMEAELQSKTGDIIGNQANTNYVMMFNSMIDGKPEFSQLREDMNKPLYIDFLGNITTLSGIVVVPAAANSNMFVPGETPMSNAMFINGYPDIKMDEKDNYGLASLSDGRKYVMTLLEGGKLMRFFKPNLGNKAGGTGDEIYTLPFISTFTDSGDPDQEAGKKITLIDYAKDFKNYDNSLFKNFGNLDINSKVYVNNGAAINNITSTGTETIKTQKISTAGGYADWQLIKEVNQMYINTKLPLNELKLIQLVLSSQNHKDQLKSIELNDYLSEEQLLKNDALTKFFGTIFEGINDNLLSKLDKNFLMYTPTQDKLPIFENSGMYTQRVMIMLILLAFSYIVIRFAVVIMSKQYYKAKPIFISLVALLLIGGFNLYLFNPLINLLFNKPADKLLNEVTPLYVLEMTENSYKDQSSKFFTGDPNKDRVNPGNPSVTLEKLNKETVASLRSYGDNTGALNDALYTPTLDQTKLQVQGPHIYLQGNDLKIDLKDLYNNYEIVDIKGFNGITMDVGVTRGTEANNYMPYLQFLKTLTNRINRSSIATYPPLNRIKYRQGVSKTTGRSQAYFNSITFIDYEKLLDLKGTLRDQYAINLEEMEKYTSDYMRQQLGIKLLDENMKQSLKNPNFVPGEQVFDEKGNPIFTKEQSEFIKKKAEMTKALDKLENNYQQIISLDEIDNKDWLGIRFILGLEEDPTVTPNGITPNLYNARWYPQDVRDGNGAIVNEDRTWEKIYRINNDTKNFVLKQIAPIAGSVSDDSVIKTVAMYAMIRFNNEFSTLGKELYPKSINTEGLSNEFVTRSSFIPRDEVFISKYSQVSEYLGLKTGWVGLLLASIDRTAYTLRMVLRLFLIVLTILALPLMSLYYYIISNSKQSTYLKGIGVNILVLSLLYIAEILLFRINNSLIGKVSLLTTLLIDTVFQILISIVYVWLTKNILNNFGNFGFEGLMNKVSVLRTGTDLNSNDYEMTSDIIEDDFINNSDFDFDNDTFYQDSDLYRNDLGNTVDEYTEFRVDDNLETENTEEENDTFVGINGDEEINDNIADVANIDTENTSENINSLEDVSSQEELIKFFEDRTKNREEE